MKKPVYAKALGVVVGLALGLLACAHSYRLVPAPGAVSPQAGGRAATSENQGVRITANAQVWNGNPPTLNDFVLPVWVQVENNSGKDLWIGYNKLMMLGPEGSGVALHAVPPFKVNGKTIVATSVGNPQIEAVGFRVAPYLGPSYAGFGDPWRGVDFPNDFEYYVDQTSYWQEYLPTPDMVRWALPEGAVSNGGKIAGFVYFQKLKTGVASLILRDDLVDASSGQVFGQVDVPFAVVKG